VSQVVVGTSFITLPDGRRLAYLDSAIPTGVPVLFLHGLLHLLPGESHLFFLSRWREILADLLSLG